MVDMVGAEYGIGDLVRVVDVDAVARGAKVEDFDGSDILVTVYPKFDEIEAAKKRRKAAPKPHALVVPADQVLVLAEQLAPGMLAIAVP